MRSDKQKNATHHCPGCGVELDFVARYPWYFCKSCMKKACDFYGRELVFFNSGLTGGLAWSYADAPNQTMSKRVSSVKCLINGRPVIVTEARFGGIVAQPVGDEPRAGDMSYKYMIDLCIRFDHEKLLHRFDT